MVLPSCGPCDDPRSYFIQELSPSACCVITLVIIITLGQSFGLKEWEGDQRPSFESNFSISTVQIKHPFLLHFVEMRWRYLLRHLLGLWIFRSYHATHCGVKCPYYFRIWTIFMWSRLSFPLATSLKGGKMEPFEVIGLQGLSRKEWASGQGFLCHESL